MYRRSDGATGLVIGAVGGGVSISNLIGGDPLGALLGAGRRALLRSAARSTDGDIECRARIS